MYIKIIEIRGTCLFHKTVSSFLFKYKITAKIINVYIINLRQKKKEEEEVYNKSRSLKKFSISN